MKTVLKFLKEFERIMRDIVPMRYPIEVALAKSVLVLLEAEPSWNARK